MITSVAVAAGVIGIRQLGLMQPLELNFYDRLLRLRPAEPTDGRLLVVGITEDDLRRWQYPVPNKTLLKALQKLENEQPRAIGLDIIRDTSVQGVPGEREALLQFMRDSGVLVTVCRVPDRTGNLAADQGFPPPEGLQPEQFGAANLGADPDNVVRRAFLTLTPPEPVETPDKAQPPTTPGSPCEDPNQVIPYFGLQLALNYLDQEKIELEMTSEGLIRLGKAVFKPLEVNTGPYRDREIGGRQGYQMLINYRANRQIAETVTLTEVLEGKVGRDRIHDRVVLIGYIAESVKDDFPTPFNQQRNLPPMPGVVIHAHVVSQILSTVLDQRPLLWFWHPALEAFWIVAWSGFGATLAWWLRRPLWLIGAIALASSSLLGLSYAIFTQAGWIPVVPPLLAFLLASGVVIIFTRGVAQAIYAGVRGFLKLDIEIDKEKKEKDVAEITASSYFQELQTRSEELRRQKGATPPEASSSPSQRIETPMKPSAQPAQNHPVPNSDPTAMPPTSETDAPNDEPLVVQYRPDLDVLTPRPDPAPYLNLDVDLIQLFGEEDPATVTPTAPPEESAAVTSASSSWLEDDELEDDDDTFAYERLADLEEPAAAAPPPHLPHLNSPTPMKTPDAKPPAVPDHLVPGTISHLEAVLRQKVLRTEASEPPPVAEPAAADDLPEEKPDTLDADPVEMPSLADLLQPFEQEKMPSLADLLQSPAQEQRIAVNETQTVTQVSAASPAERTKLFDLEDLLQPPGQKTFDFVSPGSDGSVITPLPEAPLPDVAQSAQPVAAAGAEATESPLVAASPLASLFQPSETATEAVAAAGSYQEEEAVNPVLSSAHGITSTTEALDQLFESVQDYYRQLRGR